MTSRKISNNTEDSRLARIRENQRRSRARRREYLEDLESRWKKCQELGIQADVELQRAARKVIEENGLLRKLLAELGLGTLEVEERLKVLRGTTSTDEEVNISAFNNICLDGSIAGSSSNCVGQGMAGLGPEQSQPSQIPPGPAETGDRQNLPRESIEIEFTDLSQTGICISGFEVNSNPSPSIDQISAFDMSLLETIPDYTDIFDISELLEPLDIPFRKSPIQDQQEQSSLCAENLIPNQPTATLSTTVPSHENPVTCEYTTKNTTPCTEVYTLLKALNSQRQEHKDMFEIVLELWNGFCYLSSGEDTEGKGCRVDNEILQKVIDKMK